MSYIPLAAIDDNGCSEISAVDCAVASSPSGETPPPPTDEPPAVVVRTDILRAAAELRAAGFALCRVDRAEKRPTYRGWPKKSAEPDSFGPNHDIGIICGPLSAPPGFALVCIDLDSPVAVARADEFLPPTGMIEGRPGKPRSHRWYLVPLDTIPEAALSTAKQAAPAAIAKCGHPGPRKTSLDNAEGRAIDFQGTGGQAVVPPSWHHSGEAREWEGGTRGEPAIAPYPDLWQGYCDLGAASECRPPSKKAGGKRERVRRERPQPAEATAEAAAETQPSEDAGEEEDDDLDGENPFAVTGDALIVAERRAGWSLDRIPNCDLPRTGHGGEQRTFTILARLIYGFRLTRDAAIRVFKDRVNARLVEIGDAWKDDEIARKVDWLIVRGPDERFPVGKQLDDPKYAGPPAAWNDPNQLAREFRATLPLVRVRDRQFFYDGTAYADLSPESLTARIREFCEAKAAEQYQEQAQWYELRATSLQRQLAAERAKGPPPGTKRKEWTAEQLDAHDGSKRLERDAAKLEKSKPRAVPVVNDRFVSEVVSAVRAQAQQADDFDVGGWLVPGPSGRYIAVANGLLNLDTFELIKHTPDYFTLTALPTAFDPVAPEPTKFQTVLAELMEGDDKRIAVIQEVFGACLDAEADFKFFAAFVGPGDNGKTVVKNVLGALLGARNYATVNLDTLSSDKFAAYSMYGKLANLIGDQPRFESDDEGKLKALTGGDPVSFERKFRDTFTARNTAKIVFCCNALPTFGDKSDAIWNRLVPVPFDFRVATPDRSLTQAATWSGELPGILNWAIEGLKRLRGHGFTESDKCEALKRAHRRHSDFTRAFLTDRVEPKDGGSLAAKQLYEAYREWCFANGYKHPLTSNMFGRVVRAVFPDAKRDVARDGDSTQREWAGLAFKKDAETPAAQPPVTASGNPAAVR